jgi:hypothetical protein
MIEGTPVAVAIPPRRMALFGGVAAALGDAVLGSVVVLAVVAVPVLTVLAMKAALLFALDTLGWS